MDILLVSKTRGRIGRLHLRLALVLLVLLVGGGALLGGLQGFRIGVDQTTELLSSVSDSDALRWQRQTLLQRQKVEEAIRQAHNDLDALALQIGRLQGEMARLDALGLEVLQHAGLASEEFALDSPPALGGPAPGEMERLSQNDIVRELESISSWLEDRSGKLLAMKQLLMEQQLQKELLPEGRPVKKGWLSSGFGKRIDPLTGKRDFHPGVDFAGRKGSEVVAVAAGVVSYAGRRSGYGNIVEIVHGDGLVTRYAHNQKNLVEVGQRVEKGQIIALMGNTGRSTGPHVHFEVLKDGKLLNPRSSVKGLR